MEDGETSGGVFGDIPLATVLLPVAVIWSFVAAWMVRWGFNHVAREAVDALGGVCRRAANDNPGLNFDVKVARHRRRPPSTSSTIR